MLIFGEAIKKDYESQSHRSLLKARAAQPAPEICKPQTASGEPLPSATKTIFFSRFPIVSIWEVP